MPAWVCIQDITNINAIVYTETLLQTVSQARDFHLHAVARHSMVHNTPEPKVTGGPGSQTRKDERERKGEVVRCDFDELGDLTASRGIGPQFVHVSRGVWTVGTAG